MTISEFLEGFRIIWKTYTGQALVIMFLGALIYGIAKWLADTYYYRLQDKD